MKINHQAIDPFGERLRDACLQRGGGPLNCRWKRKTFYFSPDKGYMKCLTCGAKAFDSIPKREQTDA